MIRGIVVLSFAFCLTAIVWAQTSPTQSSSAQASPIQASSQEPDTQTPGAEQPPAGQTSSPPAQTGFPWDHLREFSAVTVGSLLPGDDDRESHIYRSGDLIRTEGWEEKNYIISDLKTMETYGVAARGCLKYKFPFMRAYPFSEQRPGRKVERVPGGEETVDGHVCKIEDLTITGGDLTDTMKMRLWEAEDLQGFPIQVQTRGSMHRTIHFKNVVLGPQDPTLFIYPEKCQNLNMAPVPGKTPVPAPKAKTPAADSPQK